MLSPTATPAPAYTAPAPTYRRQQYQSSVAAANAVLATSQTAVAAPAHDTTPEQVQAQLDAVRAQLLESEQNLRQATWLQGRIRTTSALFLAIFAIVAGLIVVQVYLQARGWDRDSSRAVADVEALAAQLDGLRATRAEAKKCLALVVAGSW